MRLPCDLSRFPQQQDSVTAFLLEGWRSRRKTLEPLGQPWVLGNTDNGDLGWGEEMPLVRGLARTRPAQVQTRRPAVSPQEGLFLLDRKSVV